MTGMKRIVTGATILSLSWILFCDATEQLQTAGEQQIPGLLAVKPNIALKLQPAKKLQLSKSDVNSLLLDMRHEVKKQVAQLEDELAERARLRQRMKSTWSSHGAPIWVPSQIGGTAQAAGEPLRMQQIEQVDAVHDSLDAGNGSPADALRELEALLSSLADESDGDKETPL